MELVEETRFAHVPLDAPAPTFKHSHFADKARIHTAAYRLAGRVLGYVVRFRTPEGVVVYPYTWCADEEGARWKWKQWDDPRPLFFADGRAPDGRTVVLVEDEVQAEALQPRFDSCWPGAYAVASWPGGIQARHKARWSLIHGCNVALSFLGEGAKDLCALLTGQQGCVVVSLPPDPQGPGAA